MIFLIIISDDCGDHVIVYNSYFVALPGAEWERRLYFHHTGYAGGASYTMAHELHRKDNTMVGEEILFLLSFTISSKIHLLRSKNLNYIKT